MTEIDVPDELPCEKCGEMTPYDGLIDTRLPCRSCGTPHPHTPGSTGFGAIVFMIFFVVALPVAWIVGEGAILILFPIFFLMFLIFFVWFVIAGMKIKREERRKALQEKNLDEE
jgi:uncharacterized protein (DUF983 family)